MVRSQLWLRVLNFKGFVQFIKNVVKTLPTHAGKILFEVEIFLKQYLIRREKHESNVNMWKTPLVMFLPEKNCKSVCLILAMGFLFIGCCI